MLPPKLELQLPHDQQRIKETKEMSVETPGAHDHLDFDVDVSSDSTCRDNEACLCHWCKRSRLRRRGIRPSLRQRADDVGLDTDEPGWVCDLRAMGEISDGEWAELYGDNESSNSDSQEQAQPAVGAEAPGGPSCP